MAQSFAIEEITENGILGIQDCIDYALKNSPVINRYKNYAAAAKSRITQAKSAFFPTIGAGGGYSGERGSNGRTSSHTDTFSARASLNMMIFNFGKTNAQINMQKFNEIAARYDVDKAILDTAYNVKAAYYDVLAAKANRDIQIANVKVNERQYIRTKAYFEEGIRSKIDLVNAEVYLSDAKVKLVNSENLYKSALIKLNNAMYAVNAPVYSIKNTESFNFTDEQFLSISLLTDNPDEKYDTVKYDGTGTVFTSSVEKNDILKNYEFKPNKYTLEEALKKAEKNRPDILSLEAAYKAMKESLTYVKREYYPSINGNFGYNHRTVSELHNNSVSFGASLDFPTINILNTKARIDEAKAQLSAAKDILNMAKQDAYFEVQNAVVNLEQIEKRIPLLEVKVRQTLENYELADGRYAVGIGDFIQLQDAKQNYNSAQREYVAAVLEYNIAYAKLEKAMGER